MGIVFLTSGVSKLFIYGRFVSSIKVFGILPTLITSPLAMLLIGIEIILGFLLFIVKCRKIAALAACILLAGFIALSIYAKGNGIRVNCNCFGFFNMNITSAIHFIQNIFLFLISAFIFMAKPEIKLIGWKKH